MADEAPAEAPAGEGGERLSKNQLKKLAKGKVRYDTLGPYCLMSIHLGSLHSMIRSIGSSFYPYSLLSIILYFVCRIRKRKSHNGEKERRTRNPKRKFLQLPSLSTRRPRETRRIYPKFQWRRATIPKL